MNEGQEELSELVHSDQMVIRTVRRGREAGLHEKRLKTLKISKDEGGVHHLESIQIK